MNHIQCVCLSPSVNSLTNSVVDRGLSFDKSGEVEINHVVNFSTTLAYPLNCR